MFSVLFLLLRDITGMIMLMLIAWIAIGVFNLDKKNKTIENVQASLGQFFNPVLNQIRQLIPMQQVDYSAVLLAFTLWILQRVFDLLA